MRSKML